MKVSELSLNTIIIIQVSIALTVSLLFQFVIPAEWQPLNYFTPPDPAGENIVFFTGSQWFFSFSVAFLLYRNNPVLNNFLIFSIIPISFMLVDEFLFMGLYYDWYHLFPFAVDIYILWKKRETLNQKTFLFFIFIITIWLYTTYFLKLAYYGAPLIEFVLKWIISVAIGITISFFFRKKEKNLVDLPPT